MRILLLEDNPDMQQVLIAILELNGHEVVAGSHGEEGIQLLETYTPDIIISDLQMPVMNGFAFAEAIKQVPHLAQIPIVFISGNARDHDDAMRSGAYAFISKPFKIEQFNALLSEFRS